jgi:hypothetical protein
MDQKKDWVRSDALTGIGEPPAKSASAVPPAPAQPAPAPASSARGTISVEEVMDIQELAELARQIEQRKP